MKAAYIALAKAQTEMGKALKTAANPHLKSKYADLGSVMDACFSALHDNGFAIFQPSGHDEHGPYVETVFAHASGECLTSRVYLVLGKQDMQAVGSAQTYARRYGLLGLAGLAPEDDDGEATKRPKFNPAAAADRIADKLRKQQTQEDLEAAWKDEAEAVRDVRAASVEQYERILKAAKDKRDELTGERVAA